MLFLVNIRHGTQCQMGDVYMHFSVSFHLNFGASLCKDTVILNYERNMILSYDAFVLNFHIFNPGTSPDLRGIPSDFNYIRLLFRNTDLWLVTKIYVTFHPIKANQEVGNGGNSILFDHRPTYACTAERTCQIPARENIGNPGAQRSFNLGASSACIDLSAKTATDIAMDL